MLQIATLTCVVLMILGCSSVKNPAAGNEDVHAMLERLRQVPAGTPEPEVWRALQPVPFEDKMVWISRGSGPNDGFRRGVQLRGGYSVVFVWDYTDYRNYDWVRGNYDTKDVPVLRWAEVFKDNKPVP